jgi:hypothetical protein
MLVRWIGPGVAFRQTDISIWLPVSTVPIIRSPWFGPAAAADLSTIGIFFIKSYKPLLVNEEKKTENKTKLKKVVVISLNSLLLKRVEDILIGFFVFILD